MTPLEEKLKSMKGWLKFVGIVTIVGGALQALTIVGIIVAWVPIWMGLLLYQAGERAEQYLLKKDEQQLTEFMGKLNTYFIIKGLLILAGIVLVVFVIVLLVVVGISLPHLNFE